MFTRLSLFVLLPVDYKGITILLYEKFRLLVISSGAPSGASIYRRVLNVIIIIILNCTLGLI